MPPVIDREDRAAKTKAEVAARKRREDERARKRRLEAHRKRVAANPPSRQTETITAAPRADMRSPDAREPITRKERREIEREHERQSERRERKERLIARKRTGRDDDTPRRRGRVEVAGFGMPDTLLSRTARDLTDVATGLPGGLYEIGKAGALDTRDFASDLRPSRLTRGNVRQPGRRTGEIGKAIVKQYAKDYRHPIRYAQDHPGFVGLDLFAALTAGAGAGTRVGAAASAARGAAAGSKTKAALTRPSHEGGSLLKAPLPEPRVHFYKGQPVKGRYSSNPAVRAAQKARDERTGAQIGAGKASRLIAEEQRIRNAAERAPALRVAADSKALREESKTRRRGSHVGQSLAVDVVAVGRPLNAHIADLRSQAAKASGKTRKRLSRRAEILDKHVRPYIADPDDAPRISGEHPELQAIVERAREAADKRTRGLQDAGYLSEPGAQKRINDAGNVLTGAKWQPKSLDEFEGPTFNLIGKRVRTRDGIRGAVVDIQGDTAVIRPWSRKLPSRISEDMGNVYPAGKSRGGRLVGGGKAVKLERPLTPDEARERVTDIEQRVEKMLKGFMKSGAFDPDKVPKQADNIRRREAQRVARNKNLARTKEGVHPSVLRDAYGGPDFQQRRLEEARVQFEAWLEKRLEANPEQQTLRRTKAELDELDDLRSGLTATAEAAEPWLSDGMSALTIKYGDHQRRAGKAPNLVSTDDVRMMIPRYRAASPDERASLAHEVQAQASRGESLVYDDLLKQPPKKGVVAIKAGGSGAEKTTAKVDELDYDVVLDTTLSKASAFDKIDKALASGRQVVVRYVHRDPAVAYVNGVLSEGRIGARGEGRVVSIDDHVGMHVGANETIRKAIARYADNDDVKFVLLDNTRTGEDGLPPEIDVADLPRFDYDRTRNEVRKAFEQEAGRLTEAQRRAARRPSERRGTRSEEHAVDAGELGPGSARSLEDVEDIPLVGSKYDTSVAPFEEGQFRAPESLRQRRPITGTPGWRGGVPRKPGTLTNAYRGALRRSGQNTTQVLRAVAEDALEGENFLAVTRLHERVKTMGDRARPADTRRVKYAPVRERTLKKSEIDKVRAAIRNVDFETITPDEASRLDDAIAGLKETLFPERDSEVMSVPPGTELPGVVWVDRRLVAGQRKLIGSLGPVDTAQDAVKGLILYGKPGYVTPNMLGNAVFNLIQQGFLAPANWTRAVRMDDRLGFMVDEVMGSGFARSLAEGTKSPISRGVRKAGDFWGKFVDVPFRRAAFIHEARRYGYRDAKAWADLIDDPDKRGDLTEIVQRGRDAVVDYERMGPVESDVVRRVLFVYPWLKGSTVYAGHFLRDRPIQAAVFAGLAQYGNEESARDLGPLPAWARGSFKVGERDGKPYVVNPAGISPFSTPAGIIQAARGGFETVERSENLGEMASPVLQAGVEAAFGRDLFTGRELEGGYPGRFAGQIAKGLPQYRLWERGGLEGVPGVPETDGPKPGAAYPYGQLSAIGQFMLGSSSPRPVNLATLNEQAKGKLPPGTRRVAEDRESVIAGLRRNDPTWLKGEDRKALDSAYQRWQDVSVMRKRVESEIDPGPEREREKLRREVGLLQRWGVLDKADAREALRIAKGGPVSEVEAWRRELREDVFEDEYLGILREAREAAGVSG